MVDELSRRTLNEVDFVVAVLSSASVNSNWVKKELDIAMNHEIKAKRVKVLPILKEDIDVPAFLEGKLFADFRTSASARKARLRLIQSIASL